MTNKPVPKPDLHYPGHEQFEPIVFQALSPEQQRMVGYVMELYIEWLQSIKPQWQAHMARQTAEQ